MGRAPTGDSLEQRNAMTTDASPITLRGWALILGASSGFGAATSLALARAGLDVFGVHLDRKSTLPNVERLASEIKSLGREGRFFNVNAADEEKRADELSQSFPPGIAYSIPFRLIFTSAGGKPM